jgi:hypothetical protein
LKIKLDAMGGPSSVRREFVSPSFISHRYFNFARCIISHELLAYSPHLQNTGCSQDLVVHLDLLCRILSPLGSLIIFSERDTLVLQLSLLPIEC